MSTDEEMAIFGRMMKERKERQKRGLALNEEVTRVAVGLKALGQTLETGTSFYEKEFFHLTAEQIDLLDASKLIALLNETEETGRRYQQLTATLKQADMID